MAVERASRVGNEASNWFSVKLRNIARLRFLSPLLFSVYMNEVVMEGPASACNRALELFGANGRRQ